MGFSLCGCYLGCGEEAGEQALLVGSTAAARYDRRHEGHAVIFLVSGLDRLRHKITRKRNKNGSKEYQP